MNQFNTDPPLRLPNRNSADHKGNFGRVLLIGGSRGMAGSIALSSIASLHTGSGLVAAAIPDSILETVAGFHPAIMTIPLADDRGGMADAAWKDLADAINKQNAIGCGPGMGTGSGSVCMVDRLLDKCPCPLVLDADALNVIAAEAWIETGRLDATVHQETSMIWTPHAGEFERLSGVAATDHSMQVEAAIETTVRTGAVIVLKGGPTKVIGRPERSAAIQVWTNTTGNPGMATAGCGDVLTGILTSLLGQGCSPWDAARLGVWLHGLAGDEAASKFSMTGMTAWELLQSLPHCAGKIESP